MSQIIMERSLLIYGNTQVYIRNHDQSTTLQYMLININTLLSLFIRRLMSILLSVFCMISTLIIADSQGCLNQQGVKVAWWTILKVPPKTGKTGYGYYDSNHPPLKIGQFTYSESKVDLTASALTKTLAQINEKHLQHVAWNDEKPDGTTSSTKAHSKGIIAYDPLSTGFFISHSIPKYPAFVNNQVNMTIGASQNIYGQNILCISLSIDQLDKISYNLLITKPFVYQSYVKSSIKNTYIVQLSLSKFADSKTPFTYYNIQAQDGTTIKSIYKNDVINGSIFEDAMTTTLNSNLIAQTWGRPIEKAWCSSKFQVRNVVSVKLKGLTWNQADDHSKWVSAIGYACYGDMNRMSSQWKRGGAFYCLDNIYASQSLNLIIQSSDHC